MRKRSAALLIAFVLSEATRKSTVREPVVLGLDQYLPDLYGTVVVARSATIRSDPDLVRRFTRAITRGIVWAVDHPTAGTVLHAHVPDQDAAQVAAQVRQLAPYVFSSARVGVLDRGRVARSIASLGDALPPRVTPDDVVAFDVAPAAGR